MRILLVNSVFPSPAQPRIIGGAEVFSQRLVTALARKGHELRILRSGPSIRRWPSEVSDGIQIDSLPTLNVYSPWQNRADNRFVRALWHLLDDRPPLQAHVGRYLDEFRPDVLHTNNLSGIGAVIWKAAARREVPVVHTIHDYYLTCPRAIRFRGGRSCTRTCGECRVLSSGRRAATDLVSKAVSVSTRTLAIHQEDGLFRNGASTVITNAPPAADRPRAPAKRRRDVPVTFGFLGRPTIEKGVFDLAEAFGRVPLGLARLVIAGRVEDADKDRMSALAGAAAITYTGFVTPEAFFAEVDVMVVPSVWEEPCPMVIGEALAYGGPVLGARIGGIPELLERTASHWLFEPGDVAALASLLTRIASDPGEIERRRAALAAAPPRTFDDQVDEYEDVYRSVVR